MDYAVPILLAARLTGYPPELVVQTILRSIHSSAP